ncbi:MAG TPA: TolC family protein, partial [Chitinophagaceae bacterium]|nr:TolC family protein [Chitinophagaceae bacterium]
MKKLIALAIAIAVLGGMRSYGQGNKWTLRQCIDTGNARSLDVLQGDLQVQTADANLKMAKASRFPDLNASLGQGINQGRSIDPFTNGYINQKVTYGSYGLNSGVTLFNGFSITNTVKQNDLIYQAAQKESQQARDNLTIAIILAYLDVLKSEDQLTQAHNQVGVTEQQIDRLIALDKEGAIPPSQLSDMRGQFAGDQLGVITGENALESAKISLCRLMNVDYNPNMQLEKLPESSLLTTYAETPDIIYQAALEKFATVKAVDLRTQSAVAGLKVAKGQLYPTLSLNGNVNTNYSSAANQSIFLNTTDVVTQDYVTVNGSPSPVIHKQSNFSSQKIGYGTQLDNNLFTSFSLNLRVPIFNGLQGRTRAGAGWPPSAVTPRPRRGRRWRRGRQVPGARLRR